MSKRLLLADDSVTIQKVIEITFADKDYLLQVADNGNDAFSMAQAERPDLILADVFMPGKNGYELCEAVRGDAALRDVPVLLLAGTFEPFDEAKAGSCGASGWITKPFGSQDLVDKVAELLANVPAQPSMAPPAAAPVENDILGAFDQMAAEAAPSATEQAVAEAAPVAEETFSFEMPTEPAAAEPEQPAAEPFEFTPQPMETSDSSLDPFAAPAAEEAAAPELAPLDEFSFDEAPETPADPFAAPEPEPTAEPAADPFADLPPLAGFEAETAEPSPAAVESPADLPPLESFAAPEPAAVEQPVQPASEPAVMELKETDIVAEGAYGATPARVETRVAYLSDEQLSEIVERVAGAVIEKLAAPLLEQVVWEVVPDLAESMVREEMAKIKSEV